MQGKNKRTMFNLKNIQDPEVKNATNFILNTSESGTIAGGVEQYGYGTPYFIIEI